MSNKRGLVAAVIVSLSVLLVAAAFISGCAKPTAQEPVKIGLLLPFTGQSKLAGDMSSYGTELYFNEIGYKVAGRDIKLIKEDSQFDAAMALTKAKKLVEADKVDFILGIMGSHEAYAVRDYIDKSGVPLVITNAGAAGVTQDPKVRSPYIFRVSFSNPQIAGPLGAYAYNELGYRRLILWPQEYAAAREQAEAVKAAFTKAGGKIVQEITSPLGTIDFAPYFARLKLTEADALYTMIIGNDIIVLSKQVVEYGVKAKVGFLAVDSYTDSDYWSAIDERGVLGTWTSRVYSEPLDTSANKKFIEAFVKKYNVLPSDKSPLGYIGAQVIVEALKTTKGNTQDKAGLLKAIKEVKLDTTMKGPFRFDDNQNVVTDFYLARLEKVKGQLQNTAYGIIREVSDPWEYTPEGWKKQFKKLLEPPRP